MKTQRLLAVLVAISVLLCLPVTAKAKTVTLDASNASYYAYMDLEEAPAELQDTILEARAQIIFQESWVADGYEGQVTYPDGTVIELPQFSELFPDDWEIPVESTNQEETVDVPAALPAMDAVVPATAWTTLLQAQVRLLHPSDILNTPPFGKWSNLTGVLKTTVVALAAPTSCNIGYTNMKTNQSMGYSTGLPVGGVFQMNVTNAYVGVRASTSSTVGYGTLRVQLGK